ncbi:glycosyl hydrolase family 8 [Microvirga sp. 2MCAF38]|uniref:glycosyl hydrolase family 8 n=1 Tax=Microvirga sp. 2MCAF38 TaxID=3232989 RepID=UPI003F994919
MIAGPLTRLWIILGFLVVSMHAAGSTELGRLKIEGTISSTDWDAYRARFVAPTGRVIDNANGDISHSEGQGYGLLLAFAAGDRKTFEQIWTFTFTQFLIRDDGLSVWKWDPDARPNVSDRNNATDGDILIAYALARAGASWRDSRYVQAAQSIARAIGRSAIVRGTGRPVLLPGSTGFGLADRPDGPIINLSYWVFEAFPTLAALAPEYDWNGVWREGITLLQQVDQTKTRLPADWLSIREKGQIGPADGFPPEFGYNSLRIPLYLLRAGMSDVEWLKTLKQRWLGNEGVAIVNVTTGQVKERLTDQGYDALAATLACVMDKTPVPASLKTFEPNLYYPSTLYLLSMAFLGEKYPQCL